MLLSRSLVEARMIYVVAVALGLATCMQVFLSEITAGNIGHLRQGRPPNAGAALFPSILFIPLVFAGGAWLLRIVVSKYAMWILLAAFLTRSLYWWFSFAKLRVELRRIKAV
jgi:hypothetical protein